MDTNTVRGDLDDPGCPTRQVIDRIGDKWSVLVILHLARGGMRFTELRDSVRGVTPKVLTRTLRALERDGLVSRRVYAEVPPRVEYALTDLGRSLTGPLDVLRTWAEENITAITCSRERYDVA
ncbi:winged helix-turn-helix transcriptional regulator [Actinoallomurus acanthiterrae]